MKSTAKSVAISVAAFAVVGGAAAGVVCVAPAGVSQVRLAAVGVPQPLDPALPAPAPGVDLPTAAQLTGLLTSLADPNVSFTNKSNLVEGGISGTQAHLADHELKKAAKNGDLPLTFDVTNIAPSDPNSVTADVAVSGPKLATPVTQSVTFVNQGGWVLSRSSAMDLLQAAGH
ncbi:hypothetical protein [Mycobacterium parmense]|uniref:Low molecular weight antigen MTB12-like C-terminal domain-containing protein n=1 Tax=Mycobacterium parmense TaxID=185642 RepID=A0A7I7YNL7_9MYCO|nr:hypothetical protein [Mycobacterium parmense]MCV7353267.1 hypothetical protein [Mycobacterium parmense]ORW61551.1 hypothetical protein AWC20_05840 [Mycobacterium parmense]BBZ43279.1 hypothetical protein MPRM_05600 [Mycobacterium parmense]